MALKPYGVPHYDPLQVWGGFSLKVEMRWNRHNKKRKKQKQKRRATAGARIRVTLTLSALTPAPPCVPV